MSADEDVRQHLRLASAAPVIPRERIGGWEQGQPGANRGVPAPWFAPRLPGRRESSTTTTQPHKKIGCYPAHAASPGRAVAPWTRRPTQDRSAIPPPGRWGRRAPSVVGAKRPRQGFGAPRNICPTANRINPAASGLAHALGETSRVDHRLAGRIHLELDSRGRYRPHRSVYALADCDRSLMFSVVAIAGSLDHYLPIAAAMHRAPSARPRGHSAAVDLPGNESTGSMPTRALTLEPRTLHTSCLDFEISQRIVANSTTCRNRYRIASRHAHPYCLTILLNCFRHRYRSCAMHAPVLRSIAKERPRSDSTQRGDCVFLTRFCANRRSIDVGPEPGSMLDSSRRKVDRCAAPKDLHRFADTVSRRGDWL